MDKNWNDINILSLDDCLAIVNEVLRQQGKNLTPAMSAAACAAWNGHSYAEYIRIHELTFTGQTLRKRGSLLFQELAQALNLEKIPKNNLKHILQKLYVDGQLENYTHVLDNNPTSLRVSPPVASNFFGRKQELADILDLLERSRYMNVWGSPGVGKTALIHEFFERQQMEYKCCWINLYPEISFENWIKETLILMGDRASGDPREELFNRLFLQKWILILDNADSSEVYRDFLLSLASEDCSSKFIFISTRKLNEFGAIPTSNYYQLQGLSEYAELLKKLGLEQKNRWHELAEKYNRNPRDLIHISQVVTAYFQGSVDKYLKDSSTIFSNYARQRIDISQLSSLEMKVLKYISHNLQISTGELFKLLQPKLTPSQIIETLTSLEERAYVERTQNGFIVSPLIRKFIRSKKTEEAIVTKLLH